MSLHMPAYTHHNYAPSKDLVLKILSFLIGNHLHNMKQTSNALKGVYRL